MQTIPSFFIDKDERNAINLKWTLTCFEQISGMKINYHKIDLMAINTQHEEMKPFLDIFQCVAGDFHMKYLGIPLHFEKLKRENLQSLIDSLLSRMAGWRGKFLSSEAKKDSYPNLYGQHPYLPSILF
jgi:hypothetical protein